MPGAKYLLGEKTNIAKETKSDKLCDIFNVTNVSLGAQISSKHYAKVESFHQTAGLTFMTLQHKFLQSDIALLQNQFLFKQKTPGIDFEKD